MGRRFAARPAGDAPVPGDYPKFLTMPGLQNGREPRKKGVASGASVPAAIRAAGFEQAIGEVHDLSTIGRVQLLHDVVRRRACRLDAVEPGRLQRLAGSRLGSRFVATGWSFRLGGVRHRSRRGQLRWWGRGHLGSMSLESPSYKIPAANTLSPRLSFTHYVATEAGFDGGNVKISINGGAYALVPASAFLFNPYNASVGPTNPLAPQAAFTGTDGGEVFGSWGTSQVDLTKVGVKPGDRIQIRFDFGRTAVPASTAGTSTTSRSRPATRRRLRLQRQPRSRSRRAAWARRPPTSTSHGRGAGRAGAPSTSRLRSGRNEEALARAGDRRLDHTHQADARLEDELLDPGVGDTLRRAQPEHDAAAAQLARRVVDPGRAGRSRPP